MRNKLQYLVAFIVACGGSDSGTSCDDVSCAADCTAAGFSAGGVCVEGACQCSPTPPSAGTGTIQGVATLFGHVAPDHAGITVAVSGTSITTTTAGDGSYTIANVPAGDHVLTFSKPKYLDGSLTAVSVAGSSTTTAAPVVLSHGRLIGALTQTPSPPNAVMYSPDRAHAFVASTTSTLAYITTMSAVASDGSGEATIYSAPSYPTPSPWLYRVSNDAVVYKDRADFGVWARPFDASTPARDLIPKPGSIGGVVNLWAISGQYAFAVIQNSTQGYAIELVVARTDGSTPPRTVWQTNTLSPYVQIIYTGDDAFAFSVPDTTGATTAIHCVDPATGVDTVAPLHGIAGGNFTDIGPYALTPDHKWALLGGTQNNVNRTLIYQIGSTSVTVGPGTNKPDNGGSVAIETMDDSSGFLYSDGNTGYYFFGTTVTPATNPIQLIPAASEIGGQRPHHIGSVVVYSDSADSGKLKIVSVPTAGALGPNRYTLDPTGSGYFFRLDGSGARVDAVWSVGSPAQLRATSFALPLTSAPTVVSVGSPLSGCNTLLGPAPSLQPQLSFFDKGFFYLCWNTGTLYGFQPPFTGTTTPAQIDTNVVAESMQALVQGGIAYHRTDGTWWASDGAAPVKVSGTARSGTRFVDVGSWLLFDDDSLVSRVSRRDGTTIDEPLVDCMLQVDTRLYYPYGTPFGELLPEVVGANVFAPTAECNGWVPDPYIVPQANLP